MAPPRHRALQAVAYGYALVVPRGSAPPYGKGQVVGVGAMMLAFIGQPPNAEDWFFQNKFPAGFAPGVAPYFMQKDHPHDRLLLARPGSVFDLVTCPISEPRCALPFPNPS